MKGMHKCIDEINKQINIDRDIVDGTYFNNYFDFQNETHRTYLRHKEIINI